MRYLAAFLMLMGIVCLFHDVPRAQVPLTGAGQGAHFVAPPAGGVTVDTLSWATVDASSLTGSGCGASGASLVVPNLTFTHPGAASGITAVIAFVNYYNGGGTNISSISYNGVSMNQAGTAIALPTGANSFVTLYGLGNASGGSQTVDVLFSSTAQEYVRIGIMTVKGSVTTSNPFLAGSYATNTVSGNTSFTSASITSEVNDLVVDAVENYDGTNQYAMTPGGGQTIQFFGPQACTGSTADGRTGGSSKTGAATQTTSWTSGTSTTWAGAIASVQHQ